MNCQEFGKLVVDLAHGRLIEASTHEHLKAHAGECDSCAARLSFEQSLSGRLKTLAANDSSIKAPENVRRDLMAAFIQQSKAQSSAPSNFRQERRRNRLILIAAALLLFTISTTSGLWMRTNRRESGDSGAKPRPTVAAPATSRKPPVLLPSVKPTVAQAVTQDQNQAPKSRPAKRLLHRPKAAMTPEILQQTLAANQEMEETATDYLPLTSVALTELSEVQQIIRVEVPRSMLMMWGLPVSIDRARTSVKADLVFGEDGVARAIRLVN